MFVLNVFNSYFLEELTSEPSRPYPNQARPAERVVSMASNASSNTSKRSSGSSTGTAGTFSGGRKFLVWQPFYYLVRLNIKLKTQCRCSDVIN